MMRVCVCVLAGFPVGGDKHKDFVTTLVLGDNQIGDAGASAIADALRVNAVLTSLRIWGNKIGDSGATASEG